MGKGDMETVKIFLTEMQICAQNCETIQKVMSLKRN